MTTPLLISIILNGILLIAVFWIAFEIWLYKVKAKYHQDIAELYKERVESLSNSFDNMSRIATEAIESANNCNESAKYNVYKLETAIRGLKYADKFLKPRKRKEMWHRVGRVMTFDEWKKVQKELEEMTALKEKLDSN